MTRPRPAAAGFSLLELMIGALCTSLLAGAVFSVLVSGASSARRRWAALAAQSAADAAVAAVARDAREAGRGLELGDAILRNGERIEVVEATVGGGIRLLRPTSAPREVVDVRPAGAYEIAGANEIEPGTMIAALDLPDWPATAPLPAGVAVGGFPGIGTFEVRVAWGGAASVLEQWGEPRALLAFEVREYGVRLVDGTRQLRRRDDGRTWQPVADGLASFSIDWIAGAGGQVCAIAIEATALPDTARDKDAGPSEHAPPARAVEWVRLGEC
jgi:type II secretory pathway pseudopilin PulG